MLFFLRRALIVFVFIVLRELLVVYDGEVCLFSLLWTTQTPDKTNISSIFPTFFTDRKLSKEFNF